MTIPQIIDNHIGTAFSFEVLPPLKGNGIEGLRRTITKLLPFEPQYINITTHRSEFINRHRVRRRPGTVAVAAAIQNEYKIPVVPHLLCSDFTVEDIEYQLLDLQFLGIQNLLALRGDKAREDDCYKPTDGGYEHTTQLIRQINRFNHGQFMDGTDIQSIVNGEAQKFSFGVACYPEKHEEATSLDTDFQYFKQKIELGAEYGVTQLFYDNDAYFQFVKRVREAGINVPIIPGIKPLSKLSQLTVVPKVFNCKFPEPLLHELKKCKSDEEVKLLGVEWSVNQCKELIKAGVPSLHFYTVNAVDSIVKIAKEIY